MTNQNNQDYQDELDVYQAAWVLGRQRGNKKPLKPEQLKRLIEAGRIQEGWLSEEEGKVIDSAFLNNNHSTKLHSEETSPNKSLMKFSAQVVDYLYKTIQSDFSNEVSENVWVKMSKEEKQALSEQLFKVKYGYFPDFFVWKVYSSIKEYYVQ